MKKNWSKFFEITKNKPPSKLMVHALTYVKNKNKAIDIGGGALKDTRHLLSLGFDVTVIDKEKLMAKEAEKILSSKLHYHVVDFDNFNFPKKSFSLANASFALPFNSPTTLIRVLKNIKNSIEDDGILCGQLFGVNDEWNTRSNMTFYTLKEVEKLFNDMELIYLKEEEKDGTIADGTPKHWHIFHFIARKK